MMTTQTCTHCDRPTAGALLCTSCQKTLAMALVNVSRYYTDLQDAVATKQARYGTGTATKGSIGKEVPLPADGRFLDREGSGTQAAYDAWRCVVRWCRRVMAEIPDSSGFIGPVCSKCIHRSCTEVRRNRWPRGATRPMLAYLDRQFRWITQQTWVEELLEELLNHEHNLRRLIDRPADRWYAGKCSDRDPETGAVCEAELYATTESGTVTCPACGFEHDVSKRRDFLLLEAKDYQVTATEAASALVAWTDYGGTETKLVDRIRKWRDRGHLEVRDVTSLSGRDRHLYRLGDVQDLLVGDAQHAQAKRLGRAV